jgi:hypothetical protein
MDDPSSTVVFRWLAAGDGGDLDAFDELHQPGAIIHLRDGKVVEAWEMADIAALRAQVAES